MCVKVEGTDGSEEDSSKGQMTTEIRKTNGVENIQQMRAKDLGFSGVHEWVTDTTGGVQSWSTRDAIHKVLLFSCSNTPDSVIK